MAEIRPPVHQGSIAGSLRVLTTGGSVPKSRSGASRSSCRSRRTSAPFTIEITTITTRLFLAAFGCGAFLVNMSFKGIVTYGNIVLRRIVVDVALFHMQGIITGFQCKLTAFLGPLGMSSLRAFPSRSHVNFLGNSTGLSHGHLAPVIHSKSHVASRFQRFRWFGIRIFRRRSGIGRSRNRKRLLYSFHVIPAARRSPLIITVGKTLIPDNMPGLGFGFRFGSRCQHHGPSTDCGSHFGAGIPFLVGGNGRSSVLNVH